MGTGDFDDDDDEEEEDEDAEVSEGVCITYNQYLIYAIPCVSLTDIAPIISLYRK